MAATDTTEPDAPARSPRRALVLGVLLAVTLGAGGFYAAYSGLLPIGSQGGKAGEADLADQGDGHKAPGTEPKFVPVDPLVVMLGPAANGRFLRFRAELEVAPGRDAAVARSMPRVLDVLNGYLRAVPLAELEDPAALVRLRAQMLRRVQLVAGEGAVRDLLIAEFVVN